MVSTNNDPEPPTLDSVSKDASQPRPKKLLQRLSSGLSTILPGISSRRGSSSTHPSGRPETAPSHSHKHRRRKARNRRHSIKDEHPIIPQLNIPQLSDADPKCPYNPSIYHSFPSIEDERCSFCGLRPFSRTASAFSTSHRPCRHGRSGTRSSHLASPFNRSTRQTSTSRATSSDLPLDESSADVPRIVPQEIASRRIGNPPRTSSLPRGLAPTYRTSHLSPTQAHDLRSQHDDTPYTHPHPHSSSSSSRGARPVSPRLHHYRMLPHPHSHPYVHKSEVEQHIAALEAGSPSPLPEALDEGPAIPNPNEPYRDFSRTVYYGTTPSSAASTASSLIIRRVELVDEKEGEMGGRSRLRLRVDEVEIRGEQRVGRESRTRRARTSGQAARPIHSQRPSETSAMQTVSAPSTDGTLQIEDRVEDLQLRGGDGAAEFSKTYSPSSNPRLPHHGQVPRSVKTLTHSQPRRYAHVSSRPVVRSPVSQHSYSPPPFLGLRGGAVSPSRVRVPPTLYFLAGGTGRRPITLNSWKKQRGTRRFGGLLGMAVFGANAGRGYNYDRGKAEAESTIGHWDDYGDAQSMVEDGDVDEEQIAARGSPKRGSDGSSGKHEQDEHRAAWTIGRATVVANSSRTTRCGIGSARGPSLSRSGSARGVSPNRSTHPATAGYFRSSEVFGPEQAPPGEDRPRDVFAEGSAEPAAEDQVNSLHERQDACGTGTGSAEGQGNERSNVSAVD